MQTTDVLIVGAGPTGLVLALCLVRQGVSVRVVDQSAEPGTQSRAMVVHARTLELYRQLGLADDVATAGLQNPGFNLWVQGEHKTRLSFRDAGRERTHYPYVLVYPQDQHERLLVARLAALGVEVERSTRLLDWAEHGDGITARLQQADRVEHCTARYLAGCDGAHSTVRHQIGTRFEGGTYAQLFYVADVQARGPAADGEVHVAFETADFVALLAYGHAGQSRLIGTVRDERKDVDTLGFADVAHRAVDSLRLQIEQVHWFSTYRVHHRVSARFQAGRALLLGDAAHVHSPAGGQGMNTGIGDAFNLAWKLRAVLRGQAGPALLATYEAERKAFARQLVDTTDKVFSFVSAEGGFADFVRTRIAPLLLPAVFHVDAARAFMFRVLSQTLIAYPHSALSAGQAGGVHGGDRLPWSGPADADGADGADNFAPLAAATWQVHVYGQPPAALQAWCAGQGLALHSFAYTPAHGAAGFARDAAYLVRPDTHVALADPAASAQTLAQYFADRAIRPGP